MSRAALIIAGIYFTIATVVVVTEAVSPPSGGWISLRNMGTFLATLPVSAPLAMMGFEPDLDNKFIVGLLLAACTGIVYKVTALITGFFISR